MFQVTTKHFFTSLLFLLGAAPVVFAQVSSAILKDIAPGIYSGLSGNNASDTLKGNVYFVADVDGYQDFLWRTDGTVVGTKVMNSTISKVGEMVSNGSRIIFEGFSGGQPGVFATNLASTNAALVKSYPSQEIFNFYERQDRKVLFATKPYSNDTTQLWVTNGTGPGTINLGNYGIKEAFMYCSPYLNQTILIEQSTNFDQVPPVITDGTKAGTQLLSTFLSGVANFYSIGGCVGAEDLLFVSGKVDVGGLLYSKKFVVDSTSKKEFSIFGDVRRAYKNGDFYYLLTNDEVLRYNKSTNAVVTLQSENYYFGEPVLNNGKLYFIADDLQVWETDGTIAGTKKLSVAGIGEYNYDPRIWVYGDTLFYYSDATDIIIYMIDLNTGVESLFLDVFPSSGFVEIPRLWKFGETFVFPRYTLANGTELWASPKPISGVLDAGQNTVPMPLSPNPTTGFCRLPEVLRDQAVQVRVYDLNGRQVLQRAVNGDTMLDLSNCFPSVYVVVAEDKDGKRHCGTVVKR